MSAFSDAIGQALGTVNDVAGELVTYSRGTDQAVIFATPGQSLHDTVDANDVPITVSSRDWIFKASELVLAGVRTLPKRGDKVTQRVSGVDTVYEVLSDGGQIYRFCDAAKSRIRIHTQEAAQ